MKSASELGRGRHGGSPRCSEVRECLFLLDGAVSEQLVSCIKLAPLFARIRQILERRFAAESELYEEALVRSPWIAAQVKQLKDRHQRLRQELMYLEGLRTADSQTLEQLVSGLTQQLLDHEAAEDQLRQDAFPYPGWIEHAMDISGE